MMKRLLHTVSLLCFFLLIGQTIKAQIDNTSSHSVGISAGATFGGPLGQMSKYLERNGFGITTSGSFFGPTSYPVKTGPRGEYSLAYSWGFNNDKEIEFELNLAQLGEIAGLSDSGERLEIGFQSYTFGANYRFGSRLVKLGIGPSLMINRSYALDLENFGESKKTVNTALTVGIKAKALVYLWSGRTTYGNIGLAYLISYATEYGPFPTEGNSNSNNELPETDLNFSHGSVFFSFGVKF